MVFWAADHGVFFGKYWGITLKIAKTTHKKGYFLYIRILSVHIWSIWVFRIADHEFR